MAERQIFLNELFAYSLQLKLLVDRRGATRAGGALAPCVAPADGCGSKNGMFGAFMANAQRFKTRGCR